MHGNVEFWLFTERPQADSERQIRQVDLRDQKSHLYSGDHLDLPMSPIKHPSKIQLMDPQERYLFPFRSFRPGLQKFNSCLFLFLMKCLGQGERVCVFPSRALSVSVKDWKRPRKVELSASDKISPPTHQITKTQNTAGRNRCEHSGNLAKRCK